MTPAAPGLICFPDAPIKVPSRLHIRHDEELEQQLRYELAKRRGRAQAIKADVLAIACGKDERAVRLAIKMLIEARGALIGSATDEPAGYYWIATPEELAQATQGLWHRAISCLVRISKLNKTGMQTVIGQLPMVYADFVGKDEDVNR
jgi:hypothetical protein